MEAGEITALEVEEGPSGGLVASLTFKNTGNHHYRLPGLGPSSQRRRREDPGGGRGPSGGGLHNPHLSRLFEIRLDGAGDLSKGAFLEARVTSEDGRALDEDEVALSGGLP